MIILTIYFTGAIVWFAQSMLAGALYGTEGETGSMDWSDVRNALIASTAWPVSIIIGLYKLL